jgi:hypothetical protein
VQHLDGDRGPQQVLPLGLAHTSAQHQEQRTQAFALRRQGLERRLDERHRRAFPGCSEQSLHLVYDLEGAVGQRGGEATDPRRAVSFRGGA